MYFYKFLIFVALFLTNFFVVESATSNLDKELDRFFSAGGSMSGFSAASKESIRGSCKKSTPGSVHSLFKAFDYGGHMEGFSEKEKVYLFDKARLVNYVNKGLVLQLLSMYDRRGTLHTAYAETKIAIFDYYRRTSVCNAPVEVIVAVHSIFVAKEGSPTNFIIWLKKDDSYKVKAVECLLRESTSLPMLDVATMNKYFLPIIERLKAKKTPQRILMPPLVEESEGDVRLELSKVAQEAGKSPLGKKSTRSAELHDLLLTGSGASSEEFEDEEEKEENGVLNNKFLCGILVLGTA